MNGKNSAIQNGNQFLVYQTEDGRIKLKVRLENETLWLTQKDDGGTVSD